MARSRVKGVASYRRFLKRLPDSATGRLLALLQTAGPKLAADMKQRVPVLKSPRQGRTAGALRAAITSRVTPKTLRLKVGLLNLKLGRSDLFYGHILDVGRRAQVATIKKGPRAGQKIDVSALRPLRLVSTGMRDFRTQFLPDYRRITQEILTDAATGAGDD